MSNITTETKAPEVDLIVEGGKAINLSDYKGKNLVLYFYPKDDTPGCTLEANGFKNIIKDFEKLNTVVIGVSKDSLESHKKFQQKCELPFALASDYNGKTCDAYGVWIEKSMYGKKYYGIDRSTFLINGEGIIKRIWRKVSVSGHADQVLVEVKKLS